MLAFLVPTALAAWQLGGPSPVSADGKPGAVAPASSPGRPAAPRGRRDHRPGLRLPHRRLRRAAPSGARPAWIEARRGSLRAREQPPERLDPLRVGLAPGDRLVEAALGLVGAVGAAARAVLGHLVEVGERLDQVLGSHVRQPERPDAGGVDDPAAAVPGSASMIAEVEVCRPRPVTALTMPDRRGRRPGTSALTSVDLPTPLCPTSTLVRSGEPLAQLGQVAAALGHHPRHAQRAVRRPAASRGRPGRPWSGTAAAPCPRRTPPPAPGRSAAAAAPGRPAP